MFLLLLTVVMQQTKDGSAPLHLAAYNGNTECVDVLVQQGMWVRMCMGGRDNQQKMGDVFTSTCVRSNISS